MAQSACFTQGVTMLRRPQLVLRILFGAGFCFCLTSAPVQASPFRATLLGSNEVPPNASPATGEVEVTFVGNLLTVQMNWIGLVGGLPAAAHIHCCTAPGSNIGVAVNFPFFPGLLTGSYLHTFDLLDPGTYTASFITNVGGGTAVGAMAALLAGSEDGRAYVNIHNAIFPGGEIRGNLAPVQEASPVPEPATLALVGLGLAGAVRRRGRRQSRT